jgi:hypothetical protein
MNLMRSILLFVWVLGCSSGKLRNLTKDKCVEALEDHKFKFLNCVNGSAAQEFILEGEHIMNPKSGNCLPSKGIERYKLPPCSGDPTDVVKVEGTTIKNSQGFCLFPINNALSYYPCNNFDNTKTKKVVFE